MMSRYACYIVIQNADSSKEIVAQGQTYFAIQTRRQELRNPQPIKALAANASSCLRVPHCDDLPR